MKTNLEQSKMELDEITSILDKSGVAIGNEHETYSQAQRVAHTITARNMFMRQVDELRAKVQRQEEDSVRIAALKSLGKYIDSRERSELMKAHRILANNNVNGKFKGKTENNEN